MSFIIYDLTFLALFVTFLIIFLYKRRKNLRRQGLLYLYHTKIGINFINRFTKKYSKILRPLQYVIILSGYLLMAIVIYGTVRVSYLYLSSSEVARALKVPPLAPLIPYLPDIFKIDFLPPFYFTYWIIVIALIAIPHEFAHGIFARLNKIKVHSTGFGFLGPFLAAFVEPDEKQMEKSKKISQLSILAAGTFANLIMTLLFGAIFVLFALFTLYPAGVYFNTYAYSQVNISDIVSAEGLPFDNPSLLLSSIGKEMINIKTADDNSYYTTAEFLRYSFDNNLSIVLAYDDAPAFKSNLSGAISMIKGKKITSYDALKKEIALTKPGEEVEIVTIGKDGESKIYQIKMGEKGGKPYLGIGLIPLERKGLFGWFYKFMEKIKDPMIYYESSLGELGFFIYYLLWWIVLISLSVALVNMLPVGIFDGGRFFLLSVWGITGNKRAGELAFKISTWLILALIFVLMIKWVFVYI